MKSYEIGLGNHSFDRKTNRLTDPSGQDVALRHQTREVLKLMAEAPGETVDKASFFERVWGKAHVGEDSLVQCIAELRQALGDADRRIVETVPRQGYRLHAGNVVRRPRSPGALAVASVMLLGAAGVVAIALWMRGEVESPVVAVLPFEDVSPIEHRGLLGEPVSDEILANLARYPELTVIARGSSFRFREPGRDLREIGAMLGAGYIVEGSLRFDGERVAVNAALVDVGENAQVWSDQIVTELEDLLLATAEIGKRVAHQVEAAVSEVRVVEIGSINPGALLLSLEARNAALRKLSRETNSAAIALSRRAVEAYPEEPWGHVGMATALRVQLRFGWADNPGTALAQAIAHAEKAVDLAPGNYAAHFALGRIRMQQGDQFSAIEAFDRALTLNPSSADTMNALAQSYFYLGRNEQSLEALAQAARIDPLPGFVHSWMSAWVLWQAERCGDAERAFAKIASPPPEAQKLSAVIKICLRRPGEAQAALAKFLASEPGWNLRQEEALHRGIWQHDAGRERWLADLKLAGLPGG